MHSSDRPEGLGLGEWSKGDVNFGLGIGLMGIGLRKGD
jgi:hypothetical protein